MRKKAYSVRLPAELVTWAEGRGTLSEVIREGLEGLKRAAQDEEGLRALAAQLEEVQTPEGPKKIFRDARAWVVEEPGMGPGDSQEER